MQSAVVIEDDPIVREVIGDILKIHGFRVSLAESCVEPETGHVCLLGCCAADGRPDLVVAAVIAQRSCSGIKAALKALERWPATKVLLISASPVKMWPAASQALAAALPEASYSFLPKPFTASQFMLAVHSLLGWGGATENGLPCGAIEGEP